MCQRILNGAYKTIKTNICTRMLLRLEKDLKSLHTIPASIGQSIESQSIVMYTAVEIYYRLGFEHKNLWFSEINYSVSILLTHEQPSR